MYNNMTKKRNSLTLKIQLNKNKPNRIANIGIVIRVMCVQARTQVCLLQLWPLIIIHRVTKPPLAHTAFYAMVGELISTDSGPQ